VRSAAAAKAACAG